ncbi:MAG: VOC family protein [Ruthenibacterium lactatiformans]
MCEYCGAKPLRNEPILLAGTGPALPAARSKPLRNSAGGAFRYHALRHKNTCQPRLLRTGFAVDDVDAEYERLLTAGISVERPPVTYPWGTAPSVSRSGRQ